MKSSFLDLLGFNLSNKEISVNQVQEKKKRKEKKERLHWIT
jgi:hypothetical protein